MPKGIYDRSKSKPRPKHTEKTKAKMRVSMKGTHSREKHGNWKGGIYDDKQRYFREYATRWQREKREKAATRPRPENCEICGIPGSMLKKGLVFDHNHSTGQFRGWLCGRCNVALGNVKDNIETLLSMVEYLKNNT